MKSLFLFLLLGTGLTAAAQQDTTAKLVEASCGQCKFGLKGKGCNLAVRMEGKAYFVDGTDIDGHGDAHAKDGFCNAIRQAEVKGEVVNGRFQARQFRLLPQVKQEGPKQ